MNINNKIPDYGKFCNFNGQLAYIPLKVEETT